MLTPSRAAISRSFLGEENESIPANSNLFYVGTENLECLLGTNGLTFFFTANCFFLLFSRFYAPAPGGAQHRRELLFLSKEGGRILFPTQKVVKMQSFS
jgi:hypothetical protein